MNWDAIGAAGEIIGALAVVFSLVYLAAQIRAQNRQARSAAMHDIAAGYRDAVATFAHYELADLMVRANHDYESLTDAEKFQLMSAIQRIMRVWEESYFQRTSNNLDSHIWEPMVAQYSAYMSMPAIQRFWKLRSKFFNEDFRRFVDNNETTDYTLE